MEFKVISITGYLVGLPRDNSGLSSRAIIPLMFMLTQEFLKEQFLVRSCSYYISMTSLLIFLPTSDFLQMTVYYTVLFTLNKITISYNKT